MHISYFTQPGVDSAVSLTSNTPDAIAPRPLPHSESDGAPFLPSMTESLDLLRDWFTSLKSEESSIPPLSPRPREVQPDSVKRRRLNFSTSEPSLTLPSFVSPRMPPPPNSEMVFEEAVEQDEEEEEEEYDDESDEEELSLPGCSLLQHNLTVDPEETDTMEDEEEALPDPSQLPAMGGTPFLKRLVRSGQSALCKYLTPEPRLVESCDYFPTPISHEEEACSCCLPWECVRPVGYNYKERDYTMLDRKNLRSMLAYLMPPTNFPCCVKTKVATCPQCIPPLWGGLFEFDPKSKVGFCECFTTRVILYSDQSLAQSVHVKGSWKNFLLVDTLACPNYKRTPTIVDVQATLSGGPIKPVGCLGRLVYDVLKVSSAYDPCHRFGDLTVDLSYIAWFDKLACCASSESYRTNVQKSISSGSTPLWWAVNAIDFSMAYAVFHEGMNLSSSTLKRNEWARPQILSHSVRSFPVIDVVIVTPIEGTLGTTVVVKEVPPAPVVESAEEKLRRELADAVATRNLSTYTPPMPDDMTWEPTFTPFPASTPSEFTPGQHLWKDSFEPAVVCQGITIKKSSEHKLVVKENSGVVHGQIFATKPFHFPSDGINQATGVCGRLGATKPESVETFKHENLVFKRMPPSHLSAPAAFRLDTDEPSLEEFLGEGKTEVERLIAGMGKSASRLRMLRLLNRVTQCEVDWSAEEKVFKIFVKADDKVAKLKTRIIQFVPSLVWLKIMRKIDNVTAKIKAKGATWFDRSSQTRYVWASGMTQRRLSEVASLALEKGERLVFICGDDNTDQEGDADASMYDSTQRGHFADLQWTFMSKLGFTEADISYMRGFHTGKRYADWFQYEQDDECLPSGAPWTLFLNSLGLYVYHQQLSYVANLFRKHHPADRKKEIEIASKLLGLSMTFNPAPTLDGVDFAGSEFLKGIFVKVGSGLVWVPLSSRVFKWTCRVVSGKAERDVWEKDMASHLRAVACGQKGFILDPISRIWADSWAKTHHKYKPVPYNWQNVLMDKEFRLQPEDEANWVKIWEPIMESRYNIDKETYHLMLKQVKAHATELGTFGGKPWLNIWNRDYLGSVDG
jgi:hypothetical protein